jgi:hypothetical protein
MTGSYIDFIRDFEIAAMAGRHCQAWMLEFLAACLRGDPMAIERARLRVLGSLEAQLDAVSVSMTRNVREYVPARPVFRPDDFQQRSGE